MKLTKFAIYNTLLTTSLFFAPSVHAAVEINPCVSGAVGGTNTNNQFASLCQNLSGDDAPAVIRNVITVAFVIAILLALFFLIRGGINWVTSGGDKAKVDAARQMIVAAVIGLIITFLAYFILSIVLQIFGLSLSNLVIPTIIP